MICMRSGARASHPTRLILFRRSLYDGRRALAAYASMFHYRSRHYVVSLSLQYTMYFYSRNISPCFSSLDVRIRARYTRILDLSPTSVWRQGPGSAAAIKLSCRSL